MAIQQVLFDARSPFEQFSVGFAAIGMVALIAALVRFWLNRRAPISEINSMQRVEGGIMLGLAVLLLGAAMLPFLRAAQAELDFRSGRVVTLAGCASGVERVMHERVHGVADTYFSVAGRALHFNSNPWRPGFHNADDSIRDGQSLKIFMAGDTVLRLERSPAHLPFGLGGDEIDDVCTSTRRRLHGAGPGSVG